MTWKVERWMAEVFPGPDRIYAEYRLLPRRELAVVAAAVLDSALLELLAKRLGGSDSEVDAFLGANGDGRAPCGSFGARIQLSLLLHVITENDAIVLRSIKNVRNRFAHEVKSDFNSPSVLPLVQKLYDQFVSQSNRLIAAGALKGHPHELEVIRPHLAKVPEAGAGLLLAVFCVYQAYFHRLHGLVQEVAPFPVGSRV